MIPTKIAVIDTMADVGHRLLCRADIRHIGGNNQGMMNVVTYHGTAVCSVILSEEKNVSIDVFPIFKEGIEIDPCELIHALEKISPEEYDIINISNGFTDSSYHEQIQDTCQRLISGGTIIVAAFDNSRSMTYPACLKGVIGVDHSDNILHVKDYFYLDGNTVNILCANKQRRVAWGGGKEILTIGTSFSCAFITGLIAHLIQLNGKGHEKIYTALKENAIRIFSFKETNIETFKVEKGLRISTFPFNKEIRSLVRSSEIIPCEIVDVYDTKYSGNVAHKLSEFFNIAKGGEDHIIKNIDDIDWDSFDVLVVGHIEQIYPLKTSQRKLERLIDGCIVHNKQIYAFDDYIYMLYGEKSKPYVYYPKVLPENVPKTQQGKMWYTPVPVITIAGTRAQQGKSSTQAELAYIFKHMCYKTGYISTEPSGYLYGADYVFPYGFNSTVKLDYSESAACINQMIYNTFLENKDIIFVSLQSGTAPLSTNHLYELNAMQMALLFGISSDGIILCVSPYDSTDYISRTIDCVRGVNGAQVLAILIYPIEVTLSIYGLIEKKDIQLDRRFADYKDTLKNSFDIPVEVMNKQGIQRVAEHIVNMLT